MKNPSVNRKIAASSLVRLIVAFLLGCATAFSANATPPQTVWVSGSESVVGWPTTLKGYATDADGNLSLIRFYINGPGLPGWNYLADLPASGGTATASTTWTPTQAGTYYIHIRAMDSTGIWDANASVVSSFFVSSTNRLPQTIWAGGSNPFLGQPVTLTGHATDPDGNLKFIRFYVNGPGLPGWNWVADVPATGAAATASVTWTPTQQGTYYLHIRAQDQTGSWDPNASVVASFIVSADSAPYRFQILIDVNQLGGAASQFFSDEINGTGTFSQLLSDGLVATTCRPTDPFGVNTNSPHISAAQWPTLFSLLGAATKSVVAEEEYYKMPWEWNNVNTYRGSYPNSVIAYDEQIRRPESRRYLDVTLAADEIRSANSICGNSNKIVVLARSYLGGGAFPNLPIAGYEGTELIGGYTYPIPIGKSANDFSAGYLRLESEMRGYWVDVALDLPECAGVAFEANPDTNDTNIYHQKFNQGVARCLAKGKTCYVLLPPKPACTNYAKDVLDAVRNYFALRPDLLNNPNLYFVLAVYVRPGRNVGFLTGDNGVAVNSVLEAANQLKVFRNTKF